MPDSATEPNSITSDVSNSIIPNAKTKHSTPLPAKHSNTVNNNNNNSRYPNTTKPQNPLYGQGAVFPNQNHYESTLNRRSPDGKDNEAYLLEDKKMANNNNPQKIGNDISTEIFSASNENGKINVQVTVLVGEFLFILIFCLLAFCMCYVLKAFKLIEVMTPGKKGNKIRLPTKHNFYA